MHTRLIRYDLLQKLPIHFVFCANRLLEAEEQVSARERNGDAINLRWLNAAARRLEINAASRLHLVDDDLVCDTDHHVLFQIRRVNFPDGIVW